MAQKKPWEPECAKCGSKRLRLGSAKRRCYDCGHVSETILSKKRHDAGLTHLGAKVWCSKCHGYHHKTSKIYREHKGR